MAFLSKYGVARHVYIAIPKAGSANHAVSADWTPSAGDVKISKDGGAAANVTNLPTAIAMGNSTIWDFSLTLTEMSAAQVVVTVADTATKAVDDTGFIIETYGNASGQHAFDLGTAMASQTVGTVTTVSDKTGYGLTAAYDLAKTASQAGDAMTLTAAYNAAKTAAQAGDAMALTAAYDFAKGTAAMTEAYAANGAAPTPVQAIMAVHQMLMQFAIGGTSLTVKKLDNATTAFVVTLNDAAAPTGAART